LRFWFGWRVPRAGKPRLDLHFLGDAVALCVAVRVHCGGELGFRGRQGSGVAAVLDVDRIEVRRAAPLGPAASKAIYSVPLGLLVPTTITGTLGGSIFSIMRHSMGLNGCQDFGCSRSRAAQSGR